MDWLNAHGESLIPGESRLLQEYAHRADSGFEKIVLKKNESLVEQGNICRYFTFVVSGILHHGIFIGESEKTTYLALKNSFTTALESFLYQIPARKSIRAITKTEILRIDRETFGHLMETDALFKSAYFDLIQRQICLIDDYRIDLLSLSAEDRYKKLLETEPVLLREVPLHYLASFLGISVRNMSRIRQNIK